jgi:arsenite methyltransferase
VGRATLVGEIRAIADRIACEGVAVNQLSFDREMAERLEIAYQARDIVRRRELVHVALAPEVGERVLDVGCGPGFYVSEVLTRVGESGSVTGVDSSGQMLAIAAERCSGRRNATFHEGDAVALPVESGTFDAALCVQVLEYVDDVDGAIAELHRAVRPGGRVVVWDVDWTTISWHSADPARMRRLLDMWDGHLAHPALPRTLGARLREVGFADVAVAGHAFVAEELSPDTYIGAIFPLMHEYVAGTGEPAAADADAWAAEQRELSERGAFFFSVTQFCFCATKS